MWGVFNQFQTFLSLMKNPVIVFKFFIGFGVVQYLQRFQVQRVENSKGLSVEVLIILTSSKAGSCLLGSSF